MNNNTLVEFLFTRTDDLALCAITLALPFFVPLTAVSEAPVFPLAIIWVLLVLNGWMIMVQALSWPVPSVTLLLTSLPPSPSLLPSSGFLPSIFLCLYSTLFPLFTGCSTLVYICSAWRSLPLLALLLFLLYISSIVVDYTLKKSMNETIVQYIIMCHGCIITACLQVKLWMVKHHCWSKTHFLATTSTY